jgi:hypothetical protein
LNLCSENLVSTFVFTCNTYRYTQQYIDEYDPDSKPQGLFTGSKKQAKKKKAESVAGAKGGSKKKGGKKKAKDEL